MIVFIIRKKTNFLVRVFVYSSISTTFLLGVYWFANIPAFKPSLFWGICSMNGTVTGIMWQSRAIPLTNIAILSSSISIIFIHKLCGLTCRCCSRQPWRGPSAIQRTCLEALFVMITLVASILLCVSLTYINGGPIIQLVVLALPPTAVLLSFIGVVVLLIWVCYRRRQIARKRTVLKEIGFFLVYLVVTIAAFVVFYLQYFAGVITLILALTLLSLFPLCVFAYMRYSFRTPPREDRRVGNHNRYDQTAGLQTAPPSTRVSLPTDTAAHAPNFLSPSTAEPSEATLLLN